MATRLNKIGVGFNLSNMTVGALYDLGYLNKSGDLKADVNIMRIFSRYFGQEMNDVQVVAKIQRD